MKFLIDAQLPASLKEVFVNHDVIHTSDLPQGNFTKDQEINLISMAQERVVITKDNVG